MKSKDDDLFQAWGEWLGRFHWDFYVTLTFRDLPGKSKKGASNYVSTQYGEQCWQTYIEALIEVQGKSLYWARVSEVQNARNVIHYHVLLGGITKVEPSFLEQTWFKIAGIAKVEPYNRDEKASFYIAKSRDTLDFSENFKALKSDRPSNTTETSSTRPQKL